MGKKSNTRDIREYPEDVEVNQIAEVPSEVLSAVSLPPSNEEDPWMTLSEVARYVGKSPQTIGRWVTDGLLEAKQVGPLPKIRRSTLAKFLGGSALQAKA